jgi:hypothetical protein
MNILFFFLLAYEKKIVGSDVLQVCVIVVRKPSTPIVWPVIIQQTK